ncbi:MAG: hypothetical protein IKA60_03975 [Rikenellaceae bacterium]|nr:hypothetical protein [Rikenellaceae bacterium]
MKKTILSIILAITAIGMGYYAVEMVLSSIRFQEQTAARKAVVIKQIKSIRSAENLFKKSNNRFTASFDTLTNFVLNDSIELEKKLGSADDSVAVAKGLVKTVKFKMAVIDSLKLTPEQVKNLRYIPYSNGQEFSLDAGTFMTEAKVLVPVFECKAPYKAFLADLDRQELINLIHESKTIYEVYPGIKVGAMDAANQGEGNWE